MTVFNFGVRGGEKEDKPPSKSKRDARIHPKFPDGHYEMGKRRVRREPTKTPANPS